jgi:hypothetical protein
MPRRMIRISALSAVAVFIVAGCFATLFAFVTYGLLIEAMANIRLFNENGRMAIMDGGFVQLIWIVTRAALSLAAYIGFKACEVELVARLRR